MRKHASPGDTVTMDEVDATKKIIVFDVQMGVAGDMFLGALADLSEEGGVVERADLSEILVRSAGSMCDIEVELGKERVSGITATGVKVTRRTNDGHYHVSGARMREYLEKGCRRVKLGSPGESYAKQVLDHILEAEAGIHGVHADELHLHETGAPDTLVEIIGSAYLLEKLGMLNGKNRIFSTPVSVGMGSIDISHGTVPVPAPATLEILKDIPFRFGPINGELATPTGVSLLKGLSPSFITNYSDVDFIPRHIGYGFGKRKYHGKYLNVVRALMGKILE